MLSGEDRRMERGAAHATGAKERETSKGELVRMK